GWSPRSSEVLSRPYLGATRCFFFFMRMCPARDRHSFPTRRSSDLSRRQCAGCRCGRRRGGRDRGTARGRGSRRRSGRTRASPSGDRKSTRLNSSHLGISYAVFCLKKKIERRRLLGGAGGGRRHLAL